jgi:hypothetical protein
MEAGAYRQKLTSVAYATVPSAWLDFLGLRQDSSRRSLLTQVQIPLRLDDTVDNASAVVETGELGDPRIGCARVPPRSGMQMAAEALRPRLNTSPSEREWCGRDTPRSRLRCR